MSNQVAITHDVLLDKEVEKKIEDADIGNVGEGGQVLETKFASASQLVPIVSHRERRLVWLIMVRSRACGNFSCFLARGTLLHNFGLGHRDRWCECDQCWDDRGIAQPADSDSSKCNFRETSFLCPPLWLRWQTLPSTEARP